MLDSTQMFDIPFTRDQFFDVFETYNTSVWPVQIIAYVLGAAAVIFATRNTERASRIVSALLALNWAWMGLVYHILHFRAINPAAGPFGAFFILQALIFLVLGALQGKLRFAWRKTPAACLGAAFILYATILYPLLGAFVGHAYPRTPTFGLTPCPSVIFTFGLLLWTRPPPPGAVYAIPFAWSVVGAVAAFRLDVPQDYGLGVAGLSATVILWTSHYRHRHPTTPHSP